MASEEHSPESSPTILSRESPVPGGSSSSPSKCSEASQDVASYPSVIQFMRFNQDSSSLAVGTSTGYKLCSLSSIEKMDVCSTESFPINNRVILLERLFSSSLIVIVTQNHPRKLKACHIMKGTEICNYNYQSTILSVKMNRARLIVCLEDSIFIHNIRDMKILHTIKDTPPNSKGLCALSVNSDNCYLAYPISQVTGEVQLFDALNLKSKLIIQAHDSKVVALAFNTSGKLLATASEKGTVIRIFNVENGARVREFRRGIKRCALVQSLSFSPDNQYLVLSSNTETIHIFKVEEQKPVEPPASSPEDETWVDYFSKAFTTTASSYLPTQVTETFNQARAIATITVPEVRSEIGNMGNTVAIAYVGRQLRVLLATVDGYLYIYNMPADEGGECILVKQHKIDPDCSQGDKNLCSGSKTSKYFSEGVERSNPIPTGQSPSTNRIFSTSDDDHRDIETGIEEDDEYGEDEDGNDNGPAVISVTRQEMHSPKSFEESPPPVMRI